MNATSNPKELRLPEKPYTKGIIGELPGGGVEAFFEGQHNPFGGALRRFSIVIDGSGMLRVQRGRGSKPPFARDIFLAIQEVTAAFKLAEETPFVEKNSAGNMEYLCILIGRTKYSLPRRWIGKKLLFRDKEKIPAYVAGALAKAALAELQQAETPSVDGTED